MTTKTANASVVAESEIGERYYIMCKGEWIGNTRMWWRPDRRGYTSNIAEAGLYDEVETRSIERIRGSDIGVPESVVIQNAVRVVQSLHELECSTWRQSRCDCKGPSKWR